MKKRLGLVSLLALVAMVSSCGSKNDEDINNEKETPIDSTIDTLKTNAKNDIESYYSEKLNSYGVEDKLNTIKNGLSFYIDEIEEASTEDVINTNVSNAKDYIDQEVLVLFDEMISNYKNDAKTELNTYASNKLSENALNNEASILTNTLVYGEALINNASNKASVDSALVEAKENVDSYISEYLSNKTLRTSKDNAINTLEEYKTTKLGALEDDGTVNTALQNGITSINNSTIIEEVNSALVQAKTNIDNAVSVLQAKKDLADAKTDAIANLEAYVTTKLGVLEDDGTVQNSKEIGISNINSSSTIEAVTVALNNAKADIDLKVTALEASISLKTSKNNAISELEAYVEEKLGDLVDDGSVESAKQSGISYINAANSINAVASALQSAKTLVDASIFNLESARLASLKEAAIEELNEYKATKLGSLTDDGTVLTAVTNGTTAINNATDEVGVNSALASAKLNVDSAVAAIQAAVDLANAKVTANNEISAYATEKLTASGVIDSEGLVAAKVAEIQESINTKTTINDVNDRLASGKAEIDTLISNLSSMSEADKLETLKESAINTLNSYAEDKLGTLTDDGSVASAVTLGTAAINEATDASTVETALAQAKSNVDSRVAALQAAKELADAKATAISELREYASTALGTLTDDGSVATAVTNGTTAINNATDTVGVNSALASSKANIDSAVAALQAAKELADAKASAISELESYKTAQLSAAGVTDDGSVATAVTNGTASINAATTTANVTTALNTAKSNIDSAIAVLVANKAAQELAAAKENAISELNSYYESAISGITDDGTVEAAKNSGVTAINASTTTQGVVSALTSAKSNVDSAVAVLKANIENQELATAKTNAISELQGYATVKLGSLTDDGTVSTAVTNGTTSINNATNLAGVNSALATAKTNIDSAVAVLQAAKDLSEAKETAINTLNSYYTSAISGITDDGTVSTARDNGITAINSSTTETAVNSALAQAKSNIDNAVTTIKNNNLSTSKQNAKTELSSYASTELAKSGKTDDGSVQDAISAGNVLIDKASTESEVSGALVEAKQNVLATINALSSSTQTEPDTNTSVLKVCQGLNEEIALEWSDSKYSASTTSVYYRLSSDTSWTIIDSELVRTTSSGVRADILGLETGNYSIKLESGSNVVIKNDIDVYAQDRSGYAHFNNSTGIGAYNNDGTLKSNAIVIYVTNENKNTVKATIAGKEYTGLVNILQNASKSSNPIAIRILGRIQTNQWKSKSDEPRLADNSNYTSSEDKAFFTNTFDTTYGDNLVGLTVKLMDKKACKAYNYKTTATGLTKLSDSNSSSKITTYNGSTYSSVKGKTVYDDDSYTNMLDVSEAKNVTVEGIGTDAEFFQFGFTWSKCNSIEVRNVTFTDYPEDACSFEGASGSETSYGNYWIHNNVFNKGKNNWDVSGERDKPNGDGAMDIKFCKGVTASYNRYNSCKKTGLIGGSDSNLTINVTFHHNYYNQVGSRLPLGRQANMHFYNNYYYKCSTGQDIRANAFAFSEANYFEGCTNPQKVTITSTYSGTKIKSYGDYLTGCGSSAATVVSSRTASLSDANCKPDGKTNYSNFDTNSTLFYYDSTNKVSDVTLLQTAEDAKSTVVTYAGCLTSSSTALKLNDVSSGGGSNSGDSGNTGGDSGNTGSDTNAQVLTFPSSNSYFNVTGNISTSKGSVTYNGETYTTCLKMESSTSITFTTTSSTTLTIVLGESEAGSKIKVDGTAYNDTATNVLTISLNAGSHEITKGDSCNVFYISVN